MQTSLQGLRPRRMTKSFQELRAKACRVFRVSKDDFKNSRFRESVHARSYVAHYLRTKKNASWQKIGMLLNRDHKTVLYIVRAWPENYKIARTYIKGAAKVERAAQNGFYVRQDVSVNGIRFKNVAERINANYNRLARVHPTFISGNPPPHRAPIRWDGTR